MKPKIKKYIRKVLNRGKFKRLYELASEIRKNKNKRLPNKEYIIKSTVENTRMCPNIEKPEMLFEKLLWLKCYYKNTLMTTCTDKYEVKNYIEKKRYSDIILPDFGVYNKFEEINFSKLSSKVFIKSTYTSSINQVFEKDKTNYKKTQKRFNKALNLNYFYKSREWNYKNIKPRLIVEPYLDMDAYTDYKFFVINGKVEYFAIVKNVNDEKGMQSTNVKFNLYYTNLKPFDGNVGRKKFDDANFQFSGFIDDMIKISEDLAAPFIFCRIDFLVPKKKMIFGEMTFFLDGGSMVMKPLSMEYYYGKKSIYKRLKINTCFFKGRKFLN